MYYTVTEENSNKTIAVVESSLIKSTFKEDTKSRAAVAVKDEWCYETVEVVDAQFQDRLITIAMDCTTEDGDEEIRVVELIPTTLYK